MKLLICFLHCLYIPIASFIEEPLKSTTINSSDPDLKSLCVGFILLNIHSEVLLI